MLGGHVMRGWITVAFLAVVFAVFAAMAAPSYADDGATPAGSPEAETVETEDEAAKPTIDAQNVNWALIPDTMDGLRPLNTEQLRDLRRQAAMCGYDTLGNFSRAPCVINGLDNYIRQYATPQMQAFHFGMLDNMRYDANRTMPAMERFLSRRNQMAEAEADNH